MSLPGCEPESVWQAARDAQTQFVGVVDCGRGLHWRWDFLVGRSAYLRLSDQPRTDRLDRFARVASAVIEMPC